MFTPDRRATPEWLDDPSSDAATAVISGEDIARCNTMLGGRWALVAQLRPLWAQLPRRLTLLDLASGVGDQAATLVTAGARHGVAVETIALDRRPELLRRAATRGAQPVAADSSALPFATGSVDVVICCQFLHHLDESGIVALMRECTRIARHVVVVADLRRSWFAAAGLWLASWPLGMHPVSRHDGLVSVLKGFTPAELAALLTTAAARPVGVRTHPLFRLTAAWGPALS